MSSSFEPPRTGGSYGGSTSAAGTGRAESIRDAIPDAEPIHGAHETYPKGEVGSIGSLIGDISSDFSTLMRQEVALAKAEATQTGTQLGKAVAMFAAAGIAALLLLLFLSNALWGLLDNWMDRGLAALIVAVLWGIVAAVLALRGKKELAAVKGLPNTTETAKRVPDALKGNEAHR
jgi:Putative Actinobacterial Holin-X, holin superfamily III